MTLKFEAGSVVALTKCAAWPWQGPVETEISGLYVLVEYHQYEPSAYCWTSGWDVIREGDELDGTDEDFEKRVLFVADSDLFPQIDPQGYAAMLRQEREAELWEEDEIMAGMTR